MKFAIPFNEQLLREQMTLNFNITWDDPIKKNKNRLFLGVPMLLFGALIIYGENNLGFLFVAFGTHYLYNYYNYYQHYKENKKRYYTQVEEQISKHSNANIPSIWEFTEEHFHYKDFQSELKINWSVFQSCQVIDQHLFISLAEGPASSYILGEKEVGIENFKEIVEFVKGKIDKPKPLIKE